MKQNVQTTIVIVYDHLIFRSGLRMLLEANTKFKIVGECGTLEKAATIIKTEKPSIVLLDLNLADGDSLSLISEIPQFSEKTHCIILTSEKDINLHYKCLRSGAGGLVLKEKSSEELFSAIKKVEGGELWFDRAVIEKVLLEYTRAPFNQDENNNLAKINSLTTREKEVMSLIGEGLKNKAIAERLFISETTVRHHLTSVFSKLEITSRLELVIFAFRHKLVKIPD